MDSLIEDITIERKHIRETLKLMEAAMKSAEKSPIELLAIGSSLYHVYSGMENILKRCLKYAQIIIPDSPSSHKELLKRARETDVISQQMQVELNRYRAFRHFFGHAYGYMLEEEELIPLAKDIPRVWQSFTDEIDNYLATLKKNNNHYQNN